MFWWIVLLIFWLTLKAPLNVAKLVKITIIFIKLHKVEYK